MAESPVLLPDDEYNRALIESVHPPDWKNPEPAGRYNLVVIGAGSAGLISAAIAAGLGARVALVERNLMGGDCLNVGCVPSKAMIRSARAVGEIARAASLGVHVRGDVEVDFAAVMQRMRRLRSAIAPVDSAARYRDELGVDVYLGQARFTGPDRIDVDGTELTFSRAVIATGARASAPPIPGLDETGYLTNETVFSLTERPERLAVIGAGPIGCELAQSFQRLGSRVTALELLPQVMGREDPDAAAIVERAMRADGVEIVLEAGLKQIERTPDGKRLVYEAGGETRELVVDEILVGAGRRPNVEGIGLDEAGVQVDPRTGVVVDDFLRTSNPRVFAAGDICLAAKFTHMADASARIAVQNALFGGVLPFLRKRVSALTVPWCTYTDPEVAHVGMYAADAEREGLEHETYRIDLEHNDRSRLEGDDEGFVKVLVQKGKDRILGATIVAAHAGEMIGEISVAMASGAGLAKLNDVIHPYPTQSEAIRAAGGAYVRTRLTPTVAKIFKTFLRWTR
ncbi:MAG: mercuric reductase [Deltaproteobacteria bacterium]|nr:mercuric reductase [Deltaproteobacteria bacterium]